MANQVRASHLLIKHTSSRNPVSRRTGETITLTPEAAASELTELRKFIESEVASGKDLSSVFANAASARSDCGSFRNGGDLGPFGRGQMQKPFEDASFGLSVGQLSDIVSSDSGLHIILRTS